MQKKVQKFFKKGPKKADKEGKISDEWTLHTVISAQKSVRKSPKKQEIYEGLEVRKSSELTLQFGRFWKV